MFVGHYGAALALKSAERRLSLGLLFLGVQLVDVLFFPFVMIGIERMRVVPEFTESTHFELTYMPYTHSLVASLGWASLVAAIAYGLSRGWERRLSIALVSGAAVLSHWLFDLVVHTPDLPLSTDSSPKLGFGLWNHALLTYAIEAALLLGGLWLYMRSTRAAHDSPAARLGVPILVALLLVVNVQNLFGAAPPSFHAIFWMAMGSYLGFAGVAFLLDRLREPARQG